jgi:CheY-like chemotaxis protein
MAHRILVVEDDKAAQYILLRALHEDYEVRCAADGLAALTEIEKGFQPALVIADIMMPRMDGMTFVKSMRQRPGTAHTPVIFLTSCSTPRDVIEGINVGARHYLTKPIQVPDLLNKVHKLLPPSGRMVQYRGDSVGE